jgi:hypothetical protein
VTKGSAAAASEIGQFDELFDQMLTVKLKRKLEDIFEEVVSSKLEGLMTEMLSRKTSDAAERARIVAPKQLTEKEAAIYIGMSVPYLRASRCQGAINNRTPGPPWIKFGKAVRYEIAALDAWMSEHRKRDRGNRDT